MKYNGDNKINIAGEYYYTETNPLEVLISYKNTLFVQLKDGPITGNGMHLFCEINKLV